MTEYMIVIEKRPVPYGFGAYVWGRSEIWADGKTIVEAIENLISSHKEKLDALANDETYKVEYFPR